MRLPPIGTIGGSSAIRSNPRVASSGSRRLPVAPVDVLLLSVAARRGHPPDDPVGALQLPSLSVRTRTSRCSTASAESARPAAAGSSKAPRIARAAAHARRRARRPGGRARRVGRRAGEPQLGAGRTPPAQTARSTISGGSPIIGVGATSAPNRHPRAPEARDTATGASVATKERSRRQGDDRISVPYV